MKTKTENWRGIMQILWLEQVRNGQVIHREDNLLNMLHRDGEELLLNALFLGGNDPNTYVPDEYYIGLDARATIAVTDEMEDVVEPFGDNGYARQPVSSTTGFTIDVVDNVHRAVSSIVTFSAVGEAWGPVKNLFLTNAEYDGVLISSALLTSPITVAAGDSVNMRMAMALRYCPA